MLPFIPPMFPLYAVYAVMLRYQATAGVEHAHRQEMWTRCASSSFVNIVDLLKQEIETLQKIVGMAAIQRNASALWDQLENIDRSLDGVDRTDVIICEFMEALPEPPLEAFRNLDAEFERFRALVRDMDRAGFDIMRTMVDI